MLDNASHERLRHYIEVRAEIWEAQVVATVFLRVQIQGQQLYVEAIPFVLPPVAERYREVEWILPPEPLIDGPIVFWRSLTHIGWDLWGGQCRSPGAGSAPRAGDSTGSRGTSG
jgi:hypothetical protein